MSTQDNWQTPLRVVIIGVDGGTFDLIKPWVDEGRLPTFNKLMEEGVWGELRSTMPPITAPAWSSFITGKNPGNHGLIDFIFRQPDSYSVAPVNATVRYGRSLWALLSQAGKRVLVANVPVTYPPESVNGILITGLMTPSEQSNFTYPPELADQLRADHYRIHSPQSYARGNIDRFLKGIHDVTESHLCSLRRLAHEEKWDFMMYVFRGPDRLQHGLWHFMDPNHPLHPGPNPYQNAIRDHYEYIDRYLAELLTELDERTVLIMMSDHGFGPFHKYIYMNNWLIKWGFLSLRNTPAARIKKLAFDLGITPISIYNQMLKLGLGAMKGRVTKGKGQKKLAHFFLSFNDIDWSKTRAYSLGNSGQLWINMKGREPEGIVTPGTEYETVRQEVINHLLAMHDPDSGEKLIDEVYTREMLYKGEHVEKMPDIAFVSRNFEYLSFGEYEFASNSLVDVSYGITGWHRMEGMALFYGQPIQAGNQLDKAQLEDVAPTVLYLMGQGIPAGIDGRVLVEILRPDWLDKERLQRVQIDTQTRQDYEGFSLDDETAVRQRLEDLGYLG